MGSFQELDSFLNENNDVRILILDNNNIHFCDIYEENFPVDVIYDKYDLILIPGWVHSEVAHSDRRIQYIARLTKPLIILREEDDYLPIILYEDQRMMRLFEVASNAYSKPSVKFFKKLKEYQGRNGDVPDEWIEDFYEQGFDTCDSQSGHILKKNAGEISILALSFILVHRYWERISQITISTSDLGAYAIKEHIMDRVVDKGLINIQSPPVPISFKSTDVLLAEAVRDGRVQLDEVLRLRPNPRTCVYLSMLPDQTSATFQQILDTPTFITMLTDKHHFVF